MTVYAIAQLQIRDRLAYDRYASRFAEVFSRHRGKLLVADEDPVALEGVCDIDKLVVMAFPDEPSFRQFAESPEYLEIAHDRIIGAETRSMLVRGFDHDGLSIMHKRPIPGTGSE